MYKDNTPLEHFKMYRELGNLAEEARKERMASEPRLKAVVERRVAELAMHK